MHIASRHFTDKKHKVSRLKRGAMFRAMFNFGMGARSERVCHAHNRAVVVVLPRVPHLRWCG